MSEWVPCQVSSITVPQTPADVAMALRMIADEIEECHLTLIGLWSTGFGEPSEAVIQYVFEMGDQ